ncbi:MAG: hypothetical protein MJH09_04815 [Cetobacterium sp.]|nr:hypothetical protein [Cetobacterium sp.]
MKKKELLIIFLAFLGKEGFSSEIIKPNQIVTDKGFILNKNEKINVENKQIGIIGKSVKGKEYDIVNDGEINVSDSESKGVHLEWTSMENNGEINVSNKGTGVFITAGGKLNNKGVINVSSGAGISMVSGNNTEAINNGILNVSGGNGVSVSSGKFENKGKMVITGGAGVYINEGNNSGVINNGEIIVNGGKGIYITSKDPSKYPNSTPGNFLNNKNIVVEKGTGIEINSGIGAENKGAIIVKNGLGMFSTYMSDKSTVGGVINSKNGTILVEGDVSFGMQAKGDKTLQDKVTAQNKGTIHINGAKYNGGMRAYGENSIVTNEETGIVNIISGNKYVANGIVAIEGGVGENKGEINAYNSFAVAMQGNSGSTIKNYGKINLNNNSVGMRLDGIKSGDKNSQGLDIIEKFSIGENKGEIIKKDSSEINSAIELNGGIFTNSGKIDGGKGIAILSKYGDKNIVNLKSGSKITGKIQGNNGVDILNLSSGNFENLDIYKYDALTVQGNNNISNSTIRLVSNKETNKVLKELEKKNKIEGNLTFKNTSLEVDLASENNNVIFADNVVLGENMRIIFFGKGEKEYKLSNIISGNIDSSNLTLENSLFWESIEDNGEVIIKRKSFGDIIKDGRLISFANVIENERDKAENSKLYDAISDIEYSKNIDELNDSLSQLSGGMYGYLSDIILSSTKGIKREIKNRDNLKNSSNYKFVNNSYTQDILYFNSKEKFNGLIPTKYTHKGVMGLSEKQISLNSKIGFFYGGGSGTISFNEDRYGDGTFNSLYFGGLYKKNIGEYNLLSTFIYGNHFNDINRKVKFGSKTNYSFESTVKTQIFQLGLNLEREFNKNNITFTPYISLDWSKINQGPIREGGNDKEDNSQVKMDSYADYYDSVIPSVGFTLLNSNYLLNRPYTLGLDVSYETELGNIKDNKRLKLKAFDSPYTVMTTDGKGKMNFSLYGDLNLTENLSLNGGYSAVISDELNGETITGGFAYKFNNLTDMLPTYLAKELYSNKKKNGEWLVTSYIGFEVSDKDDYRPSSGYTRNQNPASYVPKFWANIRKKGSKIGLYVDGSYSDNTQIGDADVESKRTRLTAELYYLDIKGRLRYGMNSGVRYESFNNLNGESFMSYRVRPNFRYRLTSNIQWYQSTMFRWDNHIAGPKENKTDFRLENEFGLMAVINPKWTLNIFIFRDDRWYGKNKDNKNLKIEDTQLRPTLTYILENGSQVSLYGRIPLKSGYETDIKGEGIQSKRYENRYGIKYQHKITSNLTGVIDIATYNSHTDYVSGIERRDQTFKGELGFIYNFDF